MRSLQKNKKGFALAIVLALLPCGLAALLTASGVAGFIKTDLAFKYACRHEGMSGQHQVAPLLSQLLSLNPQIIKLRIERIAYEAALATAIAQANPLAIARAEAKLVQINLKLRQIDAKQKQLIKQSNSYLARQHRLGSSRLRQNQSELDNLFFNVGFSEKLSLAPKLAVRPDSSDVAPVYSLEDDFEQRQALVHIWQYDIRIQRPFANFLKGHFRFEKSCAVTLRKDGLMSWTPQIIRGKSSSKSVW